VKQVVIENLVITSPFREPGRHFKFTDEVVRYVKNHNLDFTIPYTLKGEAKNYVPDFIVCLDDGHGPDDLLNLLIEVTGEKKKDKAAKVTTARTLWVPAINNHGGFGRWDFIEIADPWDAKNAIHAAVAPPGQKG
jgi:type III restriction enzyme